jgi:outer membrane receptor protein involved in Fe transport
MRATYCMSADHKWPYTIAMILGGSTPGIDCAAPATPVASDSIEEVTVTAQRRSENIQDVPIAIQALTSETLTQLNVQTFDDLVKYLPNVSLKTNGPGQGIIYMRGLSAGGSAGSQSSGSIGVFPNVAIYLDDQSGQLPGRNLDIYAADLERIEVLEGPQGTLFGAGAQAGVIRYITNKPKLDATDSNFTAGYSTTAHGAANSNVTAMLNIPVIANTLAVRAVIYDDSRGGYIDNVPGTFTRKASDLGIQYANYATACIVGVPNAAGLCAGAGNKATAYGVPPGTNAINNASLVADDINPVTYQGIRASALYQIKDDWDVLIEQTYQELSSEGVFYQMPNSSDGIPLEPLQVTLFTPSYDKDRFENTAWTANGRLGDLKAVYAGAYLVRNVDQVQDYTNYARGLYADYYQCHGSNASNSTTARCYSPASTWHEQERNTHQSQEIRLSTPDDWRGRAIVGAFWEDQRIYDQTDWLFKSLPACTETVTLGCLTNIYPVPGSTATNPATRNDSTAFFEDVQRGYTQYAFFTSLDFDIIPKSLTVTGGTRYYNFTNTETGTVVSSFGCYEAGPAPCVRESGTNINGENLKSKYHGFKSRVNMSWRATEGTMVYYTWSQGFRPGGFNRKSSCHIKDASGISEYCIPLDYASDSLTNSEFGWKTEFFEHRLQWNGAVYQENWDNVQVGFYDPGQLGNLLFGTNGQNFRIRGIETSIAARVTQGLSILGGASWNSSEQTNSPYLIADNPALLANPASAAEFGKPITSVANPFGPPGAPTANSPPIQGNLRIRYEFSLSGYNCFMQIGGSHTGHSFTQTGSNPSLSVGANISTALLRFENPAYSTFDASIGVAKDRWNVQLFGLNITDKIASVFTSTSQFVEAQTVNRPRLLGVSFGYKL